MQRTENNNRLETPSHIMDRTRPLSNIGTSISFHATPSVRIIENISTTSTPTNHNTFIRSKISKAPTHFSQAPLASPNPPSLPSPSPNAIYDMPPLSNLAQNVNNNNPPSENIAFIDLQTSFPPNSQFFTPDSNLPTQHTTVYPPQNTNTPPHLPSNNNNNIPFNNNMPNTNNFPYNHQFTYFPQPHYPTIEIPMLINNDGIAQWLETVSLILLQYNLWDHQNNCPRHDPFIFNKLNASIPMDFKSIVYGSNASELWASLIAHYNNYAPYLHAALLGEIHSFNCSPPNMAALKTALNKYVYHRAQHERLSSQTLYRSDKQLIMDMSLFLPHWSPELCPFFYNGVFISTNKPQDLYAKIFQIVEQNNLPRNHRVSFANTIPPIGSIGTSQNHINQNSNSDNIWPPKRPCSLHHRPYCTLGCYQDFICRDCQMNQRPKIFHKNCSFSHASKSTAQTTIVDSGANVSVIGGNKPPLDNYSYSHSPITIANGDKCYSKGVGSLTIGDIKVQDVLHCPKFDVNVLSVSQLADQGYTFTFDKATCKVFHFSSTHPVATFLRDEHGLYSQLLQQESFFAYTIHKSTLDWESWHRRFAHLNLHDLAHTLRHISSVPDITPPSSFNCSDCIRGKQARSSFLPSQSTYSHVGDLVHSDIYISPTKGLSNELYVHVFIDDFSDHKTLFFSSSRMASYEYFRNYDQRLFNQTRQHTRIIRSDGELAMSNGMKQYCHDHGITHQTTAPYTPQQNGVAERFGRTLFDAVRTLLINSKLPEIFWPEACKFFTYVHNRSIPRRLTQSRIFLFDGTQTDPSFLRIFGEVVFFLLRDQTKLQPRSLPGILLGYEDNSKAYRVFDPSSFKIIVMPPQYVKFLPSSPMFVDWHTERYPHIPVAELFPMPESQSADADYNPSEEDSDFDDNDTESTNFMAYNVMTNSSPARTPHPLDPPNNYNNISGRHDAQDWYLACNDELDAMERNATWIEVPLPQTQRPLPTRWTFDTKKDEQGNILRYRSRLVARGDRQIPGIDFTDTYAPTVNIQCIRILLFLAVQHDFEIDQLDVKTAFLIPKLNEDIYIYPPQHYHLKTPGYVLKLQKTLYGLRQAARAWYFEVRNYLTSINFSINSGDQCVFHGLIDNKPVYIAFHVDDFLVIGPKTAVDKLKLILAAKYPIKDMGPAHLFLGMVINRDRKAATLSLSQDPLIHEIIDIFPTHFPRARVPIPSTLQFTRDSITATKPIKAVLTSPSPTPFRTIIGKLLNLSIKTRPDIAYAANLLSRYQLEPKSIHWYMLRYLVDYIRNSQSRSHKISKCKDTISLKGFSDASYADDIRNYHSTSGYVFTLGGNSISWRTFVQNRVSTSSTIAEFYGMEEASKEAIWLTRFLKDIQINLMPTLYTDNMSTIKFITDAIFRKATRHINIHAAFVRECVQFREFQVDHCPSTAMPADIFTKSLRYILHQRHSSTILDAGLC